jgi:hypothetical protein
MKITTMIALVVYAQRPGLYPQQSHLGQTSHLLDRQHESDHPNLAGRVKSILPPASVL